MALPIVSQSGAAPQAPSFKLAAADGSQFEFPGHGDQRVTVLLFWATWCPYCKALMPHLQSMLDEYGSERLRVLAISIKEDGDPLAYLRGSGYQFTPLTGGDEVAMRYGVTGTPGLIVVDRGNRIVFDLATLQKPGALASEVDALGARSAKAGRLAPYWAAQIRKALDRTMRGDTSKGG
ncbi:MAG: TlpA disulfide reductase family protein [Steroidobacteraceae bacterium]